MSVGWVVLFVVLAVAGLAVLGVLGVWLFAQVRELSREVGRAGDRITRATDALERAGVTDGGDQGNHPPAQ